MISTIKSHNSNKRMYNSIIRVHRVNRDIILYTIYLLFIISLLRNLIITMLALISIALHIPRISKNLIRVG